MGEAAWFASFRKPRASRLQIENNPFQTPTLNSLSSGESAALCGYGMHTSRRFRARRHGWALEMCNYPY